MSEWARRSWGWCAAVGLLCQGCLTVGVSSTLPLKRVVVYRNGVGYFERSGKVSSDEVSFQVQPAYVGDFLATLAVMEKGGSSVKSVAFPMKKDEPPADGSPAPASGLETVVLGLDGKDHDLSIGYVVEQPVWRPSYRVVLGHEGTTLQAWGIVTNLSGEDWNDISLSLVAGAPIAFRSTLGTPVTPERPVVSDTGEFISAVPRSETSLRPAPAPPPPPAPAAAPGNYKSKKRSAGPADSSDEEYAVGGLAMQERGEVGPSQPRNLALLASATVVAGTTRYDLPSLVTVPKDSATMVLLLARDVPGDAVFMFAPEGGVPDSARHPFRVVRFTNATSGLLERGPIAVFEAGSFLGQGVLEPLSPGAQASVPFALDRSIAVDVNQTRDLRDPKVARIQAGALVLQRDVVLRTTYRVQNGGDAEAKVLLKHSRTGSMKLHHAPAGTEDKVGQGSAMVPATIKPAATEEIRVEEREPQRNSVNWMSGEADLAVKTYLADVRADPKVVAALKQAWDVHHTLEVAIAERSNKDAQRRILSASADQTRASLKSIEKNKSAADLRAKLTERLGTLDRQLAEVGKVLVELEIQINEQEVRFQEMVREIHLDEPLPEVP